MNQNYRLILFTICLCHPAGIPVLYDFMHLQHDHACTFRAIVIIAPPPQKKKMVKVIWYISYLYYQHDKYYKIWTFLKKICIIFSKNVINFLYKLCFQNYCASLM